SRRVDTMVRDLITETMRRDDGRLHLSPMMQEAIKDLRSFLYNTVYRNERVHNEFEKAQNIINQLYIFFLEYEFSDNREHPFVQRPSIQGAEARKERHRQVCDFIAGMTDRYALGLYRHIFMPKPWSVL
ncbi:MAG: deoxyguanosinetriphosphate triphosphohydrolase, partial [Candidatus Electrothrix sp. ATG2]|nr:deoxyguanosinetriphosphate triphosphohydrolase [Candidatus Electrothrix sp. ATG2]